jgi:threonine-phosphate decarboxylase
MIHHGGNIYAASRRTGIPADEIIDFSASINPLGIPEGALRLASGDAVRLVHYPEPYAEGLSACIAERIGAAAGSVICGNGSTELIYLVPRALRPSKVLIAAPTFGEYERACRNVGAAEVVCLALESDQGFELRPEAFIEAMAGGSSRRSARRVVGRKACDMAFLCNPNNPTGRLVEKAGVLAIAGAARELGCCLVVDEAFIDFCPAESVVGEVGRNPSLVVLRSMTKFYALSGLRIGYGVFHPDTAERVMEHKEPWTVNALAQAAGAAVLEDKAFEEASLAAMEREKTYLEAGLAAIGIAFVPSRANYYLLKVSRSGEIAAAMEKRGILVRDCASFAGLGGAYLRIAVRSRRENDRLLAEMADVCARL